MSKNTYIILGVAVLALVAGGAYLAGRYQQVAPAAGPLLSPGAPVTGDITLVTGSSITVAAQSLTDPAQTVPIVAYLDSSTVIDKLVLRDPAVFAQETAVFEQELAHYTPSPTTTPPVPPARFSSASASVSELAVGTRVTVVPALPGQGGGDSSRFIAAHISIQPAATAATTPPPAQ